jgi:hypothetical protein
MATQPQRVWHSTLSWLISFSLGLMRVDRLAALCLAAVVPACSFYEHHDYRIAGGARGDVAKVRRIVEQIATDVHLSDNTSEAHIDHRHPIAMFSDPHTSIEAYTRDRDVEVSLSRNDWPPPVAFRRADRLLAPALSEAFGQRFSVLPKPEGERIIVTE